MAGVCTDKLGFWDEVISQVTMHMIECKLPTMLNFRFLIHNTEGSTRREHEAFVIVPLKIMASDQEIQRCSFFSVRKTKEPFETGQKLSWYHSYPAEFEDVCAAKRGPGPDFNFNQYN